MSVKPGASLFAVMLRHASDHEKRAFRVAELLDHVFRPPGPPASTLFRGRSRSDVDASAGGSRGRVTVEIDHTRAHVSGASAEQQEVSFEFIAR